MSYSVVESSVSDGQPVELYEFRQGVQVWRYTPSAEPYSYLSAEYTPATISRSDISQSNEITKAGITLVFPRDHDFATKFLGFSPDLVTTLTIFRGHVTDSAQEFVAYWKGRIVAGKATGNEITLECESVFTSMRRTGLRARYQRTCRHTLYTPACGVNKDSFKVQGVVQSAQTAFFVCTEAGAYPDGYFSGGMVELESGATRFIVNHTGSSLFISRPFVESIGGQAVNLYPGCDHLKATCINKFYNLLNFGGFPYIPNTNPFGGSSIV